MTTTKIRLAPNGGTAPTGLAVAPVVGGGTFAAATYFWVITQVNRFGESIASNEATTAVALNGSANLTWTQASPQVTAIRIYRGTATGAENALVATLPAAGYPPATPAAYTDTGGAGTAATPPVANAFANLTLDSQGRVNSADATLAGLPTAGQLLQAIQECGAWHNSSGTSTVSALGQAELAAQGVGIEDV